MKLESKRIRFELQKAQKLKDTKLLSIRSIGLYLKEKGLSSF